MSEAPDISDTFRFPVEDMTWATMRKIIEDLSKKATHIIHDNLHGWDNRHVEAAQADALGKLLIGYNYLDRWIEHKKKVQDSEPF